MQGTQKGTIILTIPPLGSRRQLADGNGGDAPRLELAGGAQFDLTQGDC